MGQLLHRGQIPPPIISRDAYNTSRMIRPQQLLTLHRKINLYRSYTQSQGRMWWGGAVPLCPPIESETGFNLLNSKLKYSDFLLFFDIQTSGRLI